MKNTARILASTLVVLTLRPSPAGADRFGSGGNGFEINFVTIGDSGNPSDDTGFGSVSYEYRIGVHEVSRGMIEAYDRSWNWNITMKQYKIEQEHMRQLLSGANLSMTGPHPDGVKVGMEDVPPEELVLTLALALDDRLTAESAEARNARRGMSNNDRIHVALLLVADLAITGVCCTTGDDALFWAWKNLSGR